MTGDGGRLPGARRVEPLMGMVIGVDVRDPLEDRALEAALDDVFAWFRWVDDTFSTYKDTSDVSRLAAGTLALGDCDPAVRDVLVRCDELRAETMGYFDARVARGIDGGLDPSGLVKGWCVETASAALLAAGCANHSINAGGDVRVRGVPEPGRRWQVGIAHPLVRDALCAVVAVTDAAVATSGTAERGAHVFDPHTGQAALELASVTIVGDDLGTVDAYATAALAMGFDAPGWLAGLAGMEAYVVDAGGHAWHTEGWDALTVPFEP